LKGLSVGHIRHVNGVPSASIFTKSLNRQQLVYLSTTVGFT